MNELKNAQTASAHRILLPLLRCIASGAADVTEEGNEIVLRRKRPGQAVQRFPTETVRLAVSSGLLEWRQNSLSAAPPLASYLKRATAKDRDEVFQEQHRDIQTVVVEIDETKQPARRNLNTAPLTSLSRLKERDGSAFFLKTRWRRASASLPIFIAAISIPGSRRRGNRALPVAARGRREAPLISPKLQWPQGRGFPARRMRWARNFRASPSISAASKRGWRRWSGKDYGRRARRNYCSGQRCSRSPATTRRLFPLRGARIAPRNAIGATRTIALLSDRDGKG